MSSPRSRGIWQMTFLVTSAMVLAAMIAVVLVFVSLNHRIIRDKIGSRNRIILAITKEYIEYLISDLNRDIEILLPILDGSPESRAQNYIADLLSKHEFLVTAHLLDADGRIVYSVPDEPSLNGTDVSGMEYFRHWRHTGGTVFHGQELTLYSPDPYSSVISSYGDTTLVVHVDLRTIGERIQQLVNQDELVVSLHDQHGTYLIHPNAKNVRNRTQNPNAQLLREHYRGGILHEEIVSNGQILHAQVAEIRQLGWYLGVYQNEEDISREVWLGLLSMVPWLLPVILVSLLGSILASRLTTGPYRKLFRQLLLKGPETADFRFVKTGYREPDSLVDAMNGILGTIEEQTEDLIRARDQAREANKIKDQFLANVSHELLTPLNGILGVLALMKETGPDREMLNLLSLQKTAADELHDMIRNILEFTSIREGSIELEQTSVRILPVIEGCVARYVDSAADKGLILRSVLKIDPATIVSCDYHRLDQILGHLIGNALKFTDRGRVEIIAELESSDCPEGHLMLCVRDTGCGMPQHLVEDLMNAFTQGEDVNTKSYRGIGIGLSLSRSLMELMGGTMTIQSEIGVGTEIRLCLPIP